VDTASRQELIAQYREGPAVVEAAVAGLRDDDLDRAPADGGWSAREVIHHLADSEMTSAVRLRTLVAEHEPTIQEYDEMEFSRRLHYGSRPVGLSLAALRVARETTASILDLLTEEEWGRAGNHTESGRYSVEMWLEIYASHAHDHAEQIERAVAGDGGERP
jgi:DinB family protein